MDRDVGLPRADQGVLAVRCCRRSGRSISSFSERMFGVAPAARRRRWPCIDLHCTSARRCTITFGFGKDDVSDAHGRPLEHGAAQSGAIGRDHSTISGDGRGTLQRRQFDELRLPLGSTEQHGPHLPLNTDTLIAEALTARIVARCGHIYDLWQLPALPVGLSREHAWAPGTVSHSVAAMTSLLRGKADEIVRSLPATQSADRQRAWW